MFMEYKIGLLIWLIGAFPRCVVLGNASVGAVRVNEHGMLFVSTQVTAMSMPGSSSLLWIVTVEDPPAAGKSDHSLQPGLVDEQNASLQWRFHEDRSEWVGEANSTFVIPIEAHDPHSTKSEMRVESCLSRTLIVTLWEKQASSAKTFLTRRLATLPKMVCHRQRLDPVAKVSLHSISFHLGTKKFDGQTRSNDADLSIRILTWLWLLLLGISGFVREYWKRRTSLSAVDPPRPVRLTSLREDFQPLMYQPLFHYQNQEAEEGSRKGSLNQDLLNHGDSSHHEQGSKTSSDEEDTFEGQINLDKVNLISKHDPEDAQDDSELKMNRQDISCPDTTERESTSTLICQKAEQTRDKLKESTTLQLEMNSKPPLYLYESKHSQIIAEKDSYLDETADLEGIPKGTKVSESSDSKVLPSDPGKSPPPPHDLVGSGKYKSEDSTSPQKNISSSTKERSSSAESYVSTLPPDSDYSTEENGIFDFSAHGGLSSTPKSLSKRQKLSCSASPSSLSIHFRRIDCRRPSKIFEKRGSHLATLSGRSKLISTRISSKKEEGAHASLYSRSQESSPFTNDVEKRIGGVKRVRPPFPELQRTAFRANRDKASRNASQLLSDEDSNSVALLHVSHPLSNKKMRPFQNSSIVPNWIPSNSLKTISQQFMEDEPWNVPERTASNQNSFPKSIILHKL